MITKRLAATTITEIKCSPNKTRAVIFQSFSISLADCVDLKYAKVANSAVTKETITNKCPTEPMVSCIILIFCGY